MKKTLEVKPDLLPSQIVKKDEGDIEIVSFKVSDMPNKVKPRGTVKEQIEVAIEDVRAAMMENVLSNKAVVDAGLRKRKAHYQLQKAKERLNSLEAELMQ